MLEKTFQSVFNNWLKYVWRQTGAYELKLTKTNSLPYSALASHQEQALLQAKHGALVFKIPDAGYQNPFDSFCLSGTPAFVVIKFANGKAYGIDIDDFIRQRESSKRKSITEEEAEVINSFIVEPQRS